MEEQKMVSGEVGRFFGCVFFGVSVILFLSLFTVSGVSFLVYFLGLTASNTIFISLLLTSRDDETGLAEIQKISKAKTAKILFLWCVWPVGLLYVLCKLLKFLFLPFEIILNKFSE